MTKMRHDIGDCHETKGVPWPHVAGFLISILLTLVALWLVQTHAMPGRGLFTAVLALAVAQAGVQLFFFMHIAEGPGPRYHILALLLGIVFTFAVAAGSIWIMTFDGSNPY